MPHWDRQASSYVAIGRRLSHLRHALELTQRQLADFLDISGPRWANYELGTSRIPVDVALRLVERWDLSLDWIYYGNETAMPTQLLQKIAAAAEELESNSARLPEPKRR
ncbi:MAG TPA: helix-turn-helix transcriptional regulator [Microvirga sp.]|nr:helix-turn-helix transcriptional regulator [Microvirga sp.]